MKKGQLSQTEKYAVQQMIHLGKTNIEIAKELDRTEGCIVKYVEGELDKLHTTIAEVQAGPKEPSQMEKLLGKTTKYGNRNGVTIMTEAASTWSDEMKKSAHKSRSMRGNVYNPKTGKIE